MAYLGDIPDLIILSVITTEKDVIEKFVEKIANTAWLRDDEFFIFSNRVSASLNSISLPPF